MATHSSILAWRTLLDRGAWWATVHGVIKRHGWEWAAKHRKCFPRRRASMREEESVCSAHFSAGQSKETTPPSNWDVGLTESGWSISVYFPQITSRPGAKGFTLRTDLPIVCLQHSSPQQPCETGNLAMSLFCSKLSHGSPFPLEESQSPKAEPGLCTLIPS